MKMRSFMGRSVLGATLVASAFGVTSVSGEAHAWPMPKVSVDLPKVPSGVEENDRKQLSEVNRMAQEGARIVPANFEKNCEKRAADMAKAKAIYDDGKARLSTVVNRKLDEGAIRRWDEFALAFTQAEPQLDICVKYEPVSNLHGQRIPVVDADLDALDGAIAAFGKVVHKDNKRIFENWQKLAKDARQTNKKLLETEAARAASEAASLDLKKRNDVLDRADAALAAMKATTKDDKAVIDPAVWADFEAALKDADQYSKKIRTSYEFSAWTYKIYDAWFAADAPTSVASAFFGKVAGSGQITTKSGKVSFKAQKGKCYAYVGRFGARTGNEKVKDIDRVWGKDFAETIAFTHWVPSEVPWERFDGACPTKDTTLTWDVTLDTPGSKVDFRWVAIEWPRDAFPVQIAARAHAFGATNCSAAQTISAWQNHIPGLLVWTDNGVPMLIRESDQGSLRGDVHNEKETAVRISRATLAWPEKRSLPEPKYFQQCASYEDSIDPIVDKFVKCHRNIDKQFGPKYQAANKRKDTALTLGAHNAAVRELENLGVAEGKARESQCGPQEKKIEAAMTDAITKLNDWFLAGQTEPNQPDVPAYLREVDEGSARFK